MAGITSRMILAYNGVDGFCAAAMALHKWPDAELRLTSASKIGRTFERIILEDELPSEIHVCGTGFFCAWEELDNSAKELKQSGVKIFWYCGRGYLDNHIEGFNLFCKTHFVDTGTNTEAVFQGLKLDKDLWMKKLIEIAESDPNLSKDKEVKAEIADWRDLINFAIGSYLKYEDEAICPEVIRKLTSLTLTSEDRNRIKHYKKFSNKNILRGSSESLKNTRKLISKCAPIDEPVILTGESGTGKEYAANLLHERSNRSGEHFLAVNCAVFAGNAALANSTLFGHVRGAFTGATENRAGAFRTAHHGTLFLDELGMLPMEIQGKLLRVLENGEVVPEGSDKKEPIDVRVIAATNRDLPALIRRGEFLPDLYHRLNTLRIELPPLREHPDDLKQIARDMLSHLKESGYNVRLSSSDYKTLQGYDWPGNVRQLFKLLKRVAYLGISFGKAIEDEKKLGNLHDTGSDNKDILNPSTYAEIITFEEVRKIYFSRALVLSGGQYSKAKDKLDVAINTIKKYASE